MLIIRKTQNFILTSLLCIIFFSPFYYPQRAESAEDPTARELLNIILSRQTQPYGLPGSSFNYVWAQFMMSVVAAEQNGYIARAEAIDRISGILSIIAQLDKYYGFTYNSYDLNTLKPTTKKVSFQGWYLYSLIVIKNTYPELANVCQELLSQVDYYNSGMYDPSTKTLAADYYVGEGPTYYWSLANYAGSEIRMAYLFYTYLTGDKTPWLLNGEPYLQTVAGYNLLNVWHNFNFDPVLLHNQLPEYGYYKKSWDNLLVATKRYMNDNGMVLFPIRQEPLHYWPGRPSWPNTEHREAMPWLTWFISDAPVMSKAFIPGYGISRYYDNWNFYWTYGNNLFLHPCKIGTTSAVSNGYIIFSFFVYPPDDALNPANPPILKSISFMTSYDAGRIPRDNLIIELNGNKIGEISPSELSISPTAVNITDINIPLLMGGNYITLKNADTAVDYTYNLYRYVESDYRFVKYRYLATNNIVAFLDTLDDLEPIADADARMSLSYVSGYDGASAVKMAYNFKGGGNWAQMGKDCSDIDISDGDAIQFYYRATGELVDLEVKLEDIDGTIYGYRFNDIDYNLPWAPLSIPYADFTYYWGGKDRILDIRHIKGIGFTVLNASTGSVGSIAIDDVAINGNLETNTILVPGAAMEIVVDGQRAGEENCMAFLSRLAVAHNYYVYRNLLDDPRYLDSLVGWVGNYDNRVSLVPYIHNVNSDGVNVSYDRPNTWRNNSSIRITDITANIDVTDTATFGVGFINWPALSKHTYKIEHLTGSISGKVTLQGRTNHSNLITFELRDTGQIISINTYQVTTAADGSYILNNIEIGTYDLTAKSPNYLRAKQPNITVAAGQQTSNIDFYLLGGDCDGNNVVTGLDFSILRGAYGSRPGYPNWNEMADIDGNNVVTGLDFSILRGNYGKRGTD